MASPSLNGGPGPNFSKRLVHSYVSLVDYAIRPRDTSASSADDVDGESGSAQKLSGISLNAFLTALVVSIIIFGVQISVFLLLRNRLARIFKPKTYLVPERERTEPPPRTPWGMIISLMSFKDREVINKCGLDAYFFLRYLKTLLVIFVPIAMVVIPILIPLNYVDGRGHDVNHRSKGNPFNNATSVTGLDTLAWGNVKPTHTSRYGVHLFLAICVVIWVCTVFYFEMRVYIKVRQDYLTSAEHRLRASATTILVNSIPSKWLSKEALRGLFDVFPGGIRNIWLNRDLSVLLAKVHEREAINKMLESAETELIRMAKKNQMKQKAKEEKKLRKKQRRKGPTKEELANRRAQEDDEAQRRAETTEGTETQANATLANSDLDDAVTQARKRLSMTAEQVPENSNKLTAGLSKVGRGVIDGVGKVGGGIVGGVGKAGAGIVGGVGKASNGLKLISHGVENTLDNTNGFTTIRTPTEEEPERSCSPQGQHTRNTSNSSSGGSSTESNNYNPPARKLDNRASAYRVHYQEDDSPTAVYYNTVRKVDNLDDMYSKVKPHFWEFWKPPEGSYASPIPQTAENQDESQTNVTGWRRLLWSFRLMSINVPDIDYPEYLTSQKKEEAHGPAEWEKWVKRKHRPTHRLPNFTWTPGFLPGLPLINKKVDTIDWCRKELARLNMEIEEDQKRPERYPLLNSAFIQFNHQVAAHMACQSVIHHIPKQMAPRINEVSPRDVIWDNMAISWWQEWARSALVTVAVAAMIIFWTIPVAFTASLGQIDSLVIQFKWLSFLVANETMRKISKSLVGVLPALLLAILLILVPIILDFLATVKGAKTGAQKAEFVQRAYFIFLFFQVFLIVSIASFFAASADEIFANIQSLTKDPFKVLELLASNLPKSANYFFSYMILQAMSTSSGTLLQIGALAGWYLLARMFDSTARAKWSRNTTLSTINWGSFFPVYTNFACIALAYAVIAPLISLFAIITFSLLWIAQRYSMLYVTRFAVDTGGVLYPRAINQTFTGLYVMELCLAGLFFVVVDDNGNNTCTEHGVIILVVLCLTALFQIMMNRSFGPLLRYLPVTYEDEAVIRDEAFQRAQNKRLGLLDDEEQDHDDGDDSCPMLASSVQSQADEDIELTKVKRSMTATINPVKRIGTWANDSRTGRALTLGKVRANTADYRRRQKARDMEAQKAIGDALFLGYHNEIEDLAPDERDVLVRYAFLHYALRARRPTVWLPRDDIGVSDDEIRQMQNLSDYIPASNAGTALDSKARVVYGRNPPDFLEVDLINL
ncbi:Uncharacterized protein RSN1 [Ceratocystis fimbriata CBS 114723]|uniref:Uncharacterized protein RSN1 n=1 Tax=Ceratocystis fimbriata CBS 114723 TaxID=1035309 RepID=A0A2C5WCM7_9PEZI|nr:Uncharacterized protein RSN1 [Ceratocystis fimbriata CBS 114723]